jgi:predicted metal-dependent hydrolase
MQLSFQYEDKTITFNVVFRKRKTIGIKIEPPGKITAMVPLRTSQKVILESVKSKAPWIIKKLDYINSSPQFQVLPKEYRNGEVFLFLGKEYPLVVEVDSSRTTMRAEIVEGNLKVQTPVDDKEAIKMLVEKWYRHVAKNVFNMRIKLYQPYIPVVPNRVVIKEQKSRWGSCSSKNNLNFNYRAVMAPLSVIDYLIVHEMCHLVHLNHSPDFWRLVESILPEYRHHREWLKQNGRQLTL